VVAGAAAAQRGPFYGDEPAHGTAEGVEVGAKALAFSTKTIELPATNAAIAFKNEDTQPHNIAIFRTKTALNAPLFKGDIVEAGKSIVYEIEDLSAGAYYFHCDVHPTMNGNVVVT
jgi:plastocyanin